MNFNIIILGPREQIMGFEAAGVQIEEVTNSEEAKRKLFAIKKGEMGKIGIVFVLENLLRDISSEDYQKLSADALPAIIPLPDNRGSTGFGNEKIRRIVEKAVGSDIFAD